MARKIKKIPSNNRPETVLAVGAHPDDIDFGAGGTIAKWTKAGADVFYLILTDGSKGSDNPDMTHKKLAKIRRQEQKEAAKILGVKEVLFLDYPDTELEPNIKLKRDITKIIRGLKPTKVVTFNPQIIFSQERNFINHTDHRAAGLATIDSVFPLARDRLTFPQHQKEGIKPHKVKELYLASFGDGNFVSDIKETFDLKLKAVKAHKSQVTKRTIKFIEDWTKKNAQKFGLKYAEIFIRLELT